MPSLRVFGANSEAEVNLGHRHEATTTAKRRKILVRYLSDFQIFKFVSITLFAYTHDVLRSE
jgi:hypothetical protein